MTLHHLRIAAEVVVAGLWEMAQTLFATVLFILLVLIPLGPLVLAAIVDAAWPLAIYIGYFIAGVIFFGLESTGRI